MQYLVIAKHESSFGKFEVVSILEDKTPEEAKAKAKEIFDLNKDRFKELEVKLFGGDFIDPGLGVGSL